MTDQVFEPTPDVRSRLRALDALIGRELAPEVDRAVEAAREMLASSFEPFGWNFIDLGEGDVPDGIRSAGVFVLPAGTSPPSHSHPNSAQHMRVLAGRAFVSLSSSDHPGRQDVRFSVGSQHPWIVIPEGVIHEIEVAEDGELVVLSFHTVPQEELLEVSSTGERTYAEPKE